MHFFSKRTTLGLVALGFVAVGCEEAQESEPAAEIDPKVASAEIGPEGGEIVGTRENGFPGVKLVIPKGALRETVTVSLAGLHDDTPLPRMAERVGPHLQVLPEGLALEHPAALTVPTDGELRSAYEDKAEDCKVWLRDGDGWARAEPIATDEQSVTVEIDSFTTAAAGVVLVPKPPTCAACGLSVALPDPPCVSPTGYCLTAVRDPSIQFTPNSVNVVGEKLIWMSYDGPTMAPVSFNIYGTSNAKKLQKYTTPTGSFSVVRRLEATAAGSIWAPTIGSVKFREDALPTVFDANLVVHGIVVTGATDTDVTRVIEDAPDHITAKSFQSTAPLFTYASSSLFVNVNPFGTNGRFFFMGGQVGTCVGAANPAKSNCSAPDEDIRAGRILGSSAAGINEAAFATAAFESQKRVAVVGPSGKSPTLRDYVTPNVVSKMAFGDDGKIYAINTTRAEVMILDTDGGISTLSLSDAPVDSDEYLSMLPRDIFRIAGHDELLVIVKGTADLKSRLFRIRKPD